MEANSDFTPYVFRSSVVNARTDLDKKFVQRNWNSSLAPITEYSPDDDTTIRLFTEVADFIKTARAHNGAGPEDALYFQCNAPTLNISSIGAGGSESCKALQSQLTLTSTAIDRACSLVEMPERIGAQVPIATLDPAKLQSLETQVPVLLAPELQLSFPSNVVPIAHASTLRSALRKIFVDAISIQVDSAIAQSTKAIAQLKNGNCGETAALSGDLDASLQALQRAKVFLLNTKTISCANLPYPSLTKTEREIFSMYYGMLSWRNRGGGPWKLDGTNTARRTWAGIPFSLIAQINGSKNGSDIGAAMVQRLQLQGWKKWWNMGQNGASDKYADLMNMTERGVYQIGVGSPYSLGGLFGGASAEQILHDEGFSTEIWRMAGMQFGNCYYDAQLVNKTEHIGDNWPAPLVQFLDGNTSMAELCAGAVFGLGLSKTLLQNQSCH